MELKIKLETSRSIGYNVMTVEARGTTVVWATGGQEALLKIGPPLSFEGKVLSS